VCTKKSLPAPGQGKRYLNRGRKFLGAIRPLLKKKDPGRQAWRKRVGASRSDSPNRTVEQIARNDQVPANRRRKASENDYCLKGRTHAGVKCKRKKSMEKIFREKHTRIARRKKSSVTASKGMAGGLIREASTRKEQNKTSREPERGLAKGRSSSERQEGQKRRESARAGALPENSRELLVKRARKGSWEKRLHFGRPREVGKSLEGGGGGKNENLSFLEAAIGSSRA